MGELIKSSDISEEDYRAIEDAVLETARGRWFLAEYAKRNRVSETSRVLDAIDSLKTYITREHEPADVLQMRLDIVDMTQKIEQIKMEIANTDASSPGLSDAAIELNVVVDETEKATSDILTAAEKVQEIAWEVRETGHATDECEKLDALATEIYMACSFQDVTGQRLRKVVQLAAMIEVRLKSMVSLWNEDELARYRETPNPNSNTSLTNGPAMPENAQAQDDIDAVMNSKGISIDQPDAFQLDWSNEDGAVVVEEEPFVIDDTFEYAEEQDMAAFEADASDDTVYQAPVTDDIIEEPSEIEAGEETAEEEIRPLDQRTALFS